MAEQLNDVSGTNGWKVRIYRLPYMDRIDFYFYRTADGGATVLGPDGLMKRVNDGDLHPEPTLSLNSYDAKAIMTALAEAISREGVCTPDAERLRGTMEAQGRHLEDLRTLLKLNKHRGDRK